MELRPGFKQTDAGAIPIGWSVTPISAIVSDFRGGASLKPSDFTKLGVKVLPKGGVNRTAYLQIAEDELQYCAQAYADAHPRNQVDASYTIVVLRDLVPSGPSIGLMVQMKDNEPYVLAQGVYGFKVDEHLAIPAYLVQLSNAFWYRKLVNSIMVGSTQVHITNTAFKSIKIPLPPLPEQHAIAAALNDVDALIDSLNQLIIKKRDLKQAVMQELLTGKKRLAGFGGAKYKQTDIDLIPEDWEVKQLGELFEVSSSKRVFQSEWKTEGIPFYRARELAILGETGHVENELFISTKMYNTYKAMYGVPKIGDILVTGVGTLGKVYVVSDGHEFYFKDGNIIWFKSSGKVNSNFLKQLYLTKLVTKQIEDASAGTTVGTYTISGAKKTLIPFPSLEEQTAITGVLSDMDAEIAEIEYRLEITRALKQGMVQELLTGKTRLVGL